MFYVYILQLANDQLYTGYTADLKVEDTTNTHRYYDISFSIVNLYG